MTTTLLRVHLVLLGLAMSSVLCVDEFASTAKYCAVWRDIQPCSCTTRTILQQEPVTEILCEKMESFGDVIHLLQDRFFHTHEVHLRVSYSRLDDLEYRSFKELNMTISNLKLDNNQLR